MKFPELYRMKNEFPGLESKEGDQFGLFMIPAKYAKKRKLKAIADSGSKSGWEHVSVSLPDFPELCPSWDEMCLVKDLFFCDEECVVQYHPKKQDYVNVHPGVLHLWKQVGVEFAMPPKICV